MYDKQKDFSALSDVRLLEGVVGKPVRVQIPPSAPAFTPLGLNRYATFPHRSNLDRNERFVHVRCQLERCASLDETVEIILQVFDPPANLASWTKFIQRLIHPTHRHMQIRSRVNVFIPYHGGPLEGGGRK
jgi:hypothetical protein